MLKIYSFGTKFLSSAFAASPDNIELDQDIDLIRGNYKNLIFPIIFRYFAGKKLMDVMPTGYPSLYLISDKFKKTLEDNHLTGWQSYPIILLDKNEQEIPGYHGFSITGTSDSKDFSESKIIEKQFVKHGPIVKFYKGFKIRPHGNVDFFIPSHTTGFCISEKAAKILEKNKITNLQLEDSEEYEIDCSIIDENNSS